MSCLVIRIRPGPAVGFSSRTLHRGKYLSCILQRSFFPRRNAAENRSHKGIDQARNRAAAITIPISQRVPVCPDTHVQENPPKLLTHEPPFIQGLPLGAAHSSTSGYKRNRHTKSSHYASACKHKHTVRITNWIEIFPRPLYGADTINSNPGTCMRTSRRQRFG